MCIDKYEPTISYEKYIRDIIDLNVKGIMGIMDEREKAATVAAQALITKESHDQMAKYVLKQELDLRMKETKEQITGPLGLELRMRCVEQESHGAADREKRISALELSRGTLDAKMWMIVIGLSAFVTASLTAFLHYFLK